MSNDFPGYEVVRALERIALALENIAKDLGKTREREVGSESHRLATEYRALRNRLRYADAQCLQHHAHSRLQSMWSREFEAAYKLITEFEAAHPEFAVAVSPPQEEVQS